MPKKVTQTQIDSYMQTLSTTPGRIGEFTESLDDAALTTQPEPGVWSALEHMAHLRAAAELWTHSIYMMIMLDAPELAFVHPRQWMKKMGYTKLAFGENFAAYEIERRHLMRMLAGLSFEDWNRSCRFAGKVNTFTIFGEVMRMALHEIDHLPQIEALCKR